MRADDALPAGTVSAGAEAPGPRSRLAWFMRRAWWLHSIWALSFGVGVMLFARQGLAYADKMLMVLGLSWLVLFIALRFIVGPSNRAPHEPLARRGVRVITNYVIKNLYQQMFFFLVPIYASSATFSLSSYNFWLPPVLLVFAVLSTLDLVFDNFIMERRALAAAMYGVALFGVLNMLLPLALDIGHFPALLISAGLTSPAVALLSFRLRTVFTIKGMVLTLGMSAGLGAAAWFGRAAVPPAPLAMRDGAVGHGTLSSYECLPGKKRIMRVTELDGLRCGSMISEPGGLRERIFHVWKHQGETVLRVEPTLMSECDGEVYRSFLPVPSLPADPAGKWSCVVETQDGQLVGAMRFEVVDVRGWPSMLPSILPPGPSSDLPSGLSSSITDAGAVDGTGRGTGDASTVDGSVPADAGWARDADMADADASPGHADASQVR